MKRQVVVMVSIALVSFLAGALFSMGSTGLGIMPNPFSKEIKSSLQTIRFQSPDEIFIPSEPINETRYHTLTVANFTWTPRDSLNNFILSAYYWAEFKSPATHSLSADRRLLINGAGSDVH